MDNVPVTSTSTTAKTPQLDARLRQMHNDPDFEPDYRPDFKPLVTPKGIASVKNKINEFDVFLLPAPSSWIAARASVLLQFYFTPETSESLADLAMRGWVRHLEKFPAWAINEACEWWEANEESKRPTPAAIVRLCRESVEPHQETRRKLQNIVNKSTVREMTREDRMRPIGKPVNTGKPKADLVGMSHGPDPNSPFFYARPENIPPNSDREASAIWAQKLIEEVSESLTGSFSGPLTASLNQGFNERSET